jgi:hypothetical protein
MTAPASILAETDPSMRIVFGIIFAAIWIFSAIFKSASENAKKRQLRETLQRTRDAISSAGVPAPGRQPVQLAPEIQMRVPPVGKSRPPASRQVKSPRRAASSRQRAVAIPPELPRVASASLAERTAPFSGVLTSPATGAPAAKAPTAVDAKAMSGWLRPATLRQQFILTEIFQPPLALRDS